MEQTGPTKDIPAKTPSPRMFLYAFYVAAIAALSASWALAVATLGNPARDDVLLDKFDAQCDVSAEHLCLIVLGDSRLWFALDDRKAAERLSQSLGRPVSVTGFYVPNAEIAAFRPILRRLPSAGADAVLLDDRLPWKDLGYARRFQTNIKTIYERVFLFTRASQERLTMQNSCVNLIAKASEPSDLILDRSAQAAAARLSALHSWARELPVAVVAAPSPVNENVEMPALGKTVYTLSPDPHIPPSNYCDNVHVDETGKAIYTNAFSDAVGDWIEAANL